MSQSSLSWWRALVAASAKSATSKAPPNAARNSAALAALALINGYLSANIAVRLTAGITLLPGDVVDVVVLLISGQPLAPMIKTVALTYFATSALMLLIVVLASIDKKTAKRGMDMLAGSLLAISLFVLVSSVAFSLYTDSEGFNSPLLLWDLASDPLFTALRWKAIAALSTPPLLVLLLALPAILKPRGLHGDARWATAWAANKAGLFAKAGVVLARWQGRTIIADRPGHVLGVAPTGAGKGVGWVIPTLLQWPGSAIVLDPKRENYELTAGHRASMGQRVALFDPFNPDGSPSRWNPLAFVAGSKQPIDEISKVAELLIPTPEHSDPHWTSSARSLFIGIGLHLHHSKAAGSPELTIKQVLNFLLDHNQAALSALLQGRVVEEETAHRLLSVQANRPEKEAGSVHSTLHTAMSMWEIPSVCDATGANDIDLRELRTKPTTIYLAVPPDSIVRAARLLALYWQQVMDAMTRTMPTMAEPHEVLMLMDEFTLPGKMALIKHGLGFLRGYQVTVFVVIQSINQLTEVYGDPGGRTIIDNCRYRAYMAPNGIREAQAISDTLGSTTVRVKSVSVSGMKHTRSYSQQRRPLLLSQEVMGLGNDRLIVQVEGGSAIKGKKIRYYKERRWNRMVRPPPKTKRATRTSPIPANGRPEAVLNTVLLGRSAQSLSNALALNPNNNAQALAAIGQRFATAAAWSQETT